MNPIYPNPDALDDLYKACKDVIAAMEWEDPYHETGITKEDRMAEMQDIVSAAILKAETPTRRKEDV